MVTLFQTHRLVIVNAHRSKHHSIRVSLPVIRSHLACFGSTFEVGVTVNNFHLVTVYVVTSAALKGILFSSLFLSSFFLFVGRIKRIKVVCAFQEIWEISRLWTRKADQILKVRVTFGLG